MESKNTTAVNYSNVVAARSLSEPRIWYVYRLDGKEVKVEVRPDGFRSFYFKLTEAEVAYFKNVSYADTLHARG
jgi:hypothetical protein